MTAALWFVIAASSLLVTALCSAVQLALLDLSRSRLEELAEQRGSASLLARVRSITGDVVGHRAAIGLPRALCTLVFGVAAVMWVAELRGAATPGWQDAVIGLLGASVVMWLFAAVLPMSAAEHAGERIVLSMSRFIRLCFWALYPSRGLVAGLHEGVRRLSGPESQTPAEALEAELLDVVEEHELEGDIDESEREMLEAVVSFRRLTVEEVMTPRTEIQALEYTDDLERVKLLVDDRGHSRIPVYEENLDRVVGILYAKDLLRWIIHRGEGGAQRPFVLREILREAVFVPETKTVRELLGELLARQVHIALVADEYGGTSGLVTIEDIIEEIFGEILDEYEEPEDVHGAVMIDEGARAAEVDARVRIDEANDELEIVGLELPESDDYDTVGGFVVSTLGRIPAAGERLRAGTALVLVLEAEPTRVVRVRVSPAPTDEPVPEAALRHEQGK